MDNFSGAANWPIEQIVDLQRYPIDQLDSERGQRLIEDCRRAFVDDVCCELPNFIRPQALQAVIDDVERRESNAFRSARHRSAYGFYSPVHGGELQTDDSAAHMTPQWREVCYLAYDEFDESSVLHRLYESPLVTEFAARVLALESVHHVADALMAAPISLHYSGCQLGWHCDTQEFTITVMFRPSQRGGVFEYMPLAGAGEANFERVPKVFAGDREEVRQVEIQPGSIMLFRGANTLHRVTPSQTDKPRILSVFHLEKTPGRVYDDQFKLDVFGRAESRT